MDPNKQPQQPNNSGNSTSPAQRQAAIDIVRNRVAAAYGANTNEATEQKAPEMQNEEDLGEYERTYSQSKLAITKDQSDELHDYKSAWSDYYRKYYESYYTQAAKQSIARQRAGMTASSLALLENPATKHVDQPAKTKQEGYFAQPQPSANPDSELITEKEATKRLRSEIRQKVQNSAKKVRKSRHFIPIISGVCAMFIFLFLEFNQVIFANVMAYVSPGTIDSSDIVIDPEQDVNVDPAPKLIIPKINVDAPVHYDIPNDGESQKIAMRDGLAHFAIPGANSHPGEVGNTVLAGHSSGDIFMHSDYKFIFAQLHLLAKGDKIYANYNGKRYTYVVTRTDVVNPTDVGKLVYDTNGKSILTLVTCTPLGTSQYRLLVIAEMIYPSIATNNNNASSPTDSSSSSTSSSIPGSEPTWIEKIFQSIFGGGDNNN